MTRLANMHQPQQRKDNVIEAWAAVQNYLLVISAKGHAGMTGSA